MCILLVLTGIIFEFMFGAHLGFVLITAGSLFFAVSTKLEKRRLRKKIKLLNTIKI